MKTIFCGGIVFFSLGLTMYAQPLDSLLQEAYQNNPQIRSYNYRQLAANYAAKSASAWQPPTLGLEFNQIPFTTTNILHQALSTNISFSQMFMLGGKLSAMENIEKQREKIILHEKLSYLTQLRATIKMKYYQLWFLDKQIQLQQQNIALLEHLAQSLHSQVVTNRLRQADFQTVRAEIAAQQGRLSQLILQRATLVTHLNSLLGRDNVVQTITISDSLPHPTLLLSEKHLSEILKLSNPSLQIIARMKDMNDAEQISVSRTLIPDLMIQIMAMRMPHGMILTSGSRSTEFIRQTLAGGTMIQKADWMYSLMVSVTLPFLPWSSERTTAKIEEIRSLNSTLESERNTMELTMLASLRSALNKYTLTDSLLSLYRNEILPLSQRATEEQTLTYQLGQASITTFLDSCRMELMRKEEYYMAELDRYMALIEIEMTIGTPLQ